MKLQRKRRCSNSCSSRLQQQYWPLDRARNVCERRDSNLYGLP